MSCWTVTEKKDLAGNVGRKRKRKTVADLNEKCLRLEAMYLEKKIEETSLSIEMIKEKKAYYQMKMSMISK